MGNETIGELWNTKGRDLRWITRRENGTKISADRKMSILRTKFNKK
jgi:hypothetical protein